jgi:voltage-gated potassium channel
MPGRLLRGLRREGARGFSLIRAVVLLLFVFVVGVTGYALIEAMSILEAIYTTTIILSTVGLAADQAQQFSDAGKVFTVFLIWGGVGIVAYLLTQVVGFVVSGQMNRVMRARRMEKVIGSLRDHVVVCGTDEAGEQALAELSATDTPVVVVCNNRDYIELLEARFGEVLTVEGPPIEEETLVRANVTKAKALLACLPTDAENLFLVMTAREVAPDLLIVAKATGPAAIDKLRKVGADHVVAPAVIAGTRMASVALRPTALAFLDVLTRSGEEALRLEEVLIPVGSRWAGSTLAEISIPQRTRLLVMGVRHGGDGDDEGKFVFNPSANEKLAAGDALIVLGSPEQRSQLEAVLAEKPEA